MHYGFIYFSLYSLVFTKHVNSYASVYVKEKQVLRIDLSKDKSYVVNGKLGKVHIEVKQKRFVSLKKRVCIIIVQNKVLFRMPMFQLCVCQMKRW